MSQQVTEEAHPTKAKPLLSSAMRPAECARNHWQAVIPAGMTLEQLLFPTTWAVLSERLHFLDHIEAVWADRSMYCELMVMDAGRGFAHVHMLQHYQLPALLSIDPNALPAGFNCEYQGPVTDGKGGYTVVRVADNVIITEGHASRDSALRELLDHASLR